LWSGSKEISNGCTALCAFITNPVLARGAIFLPFLSLLGRISADNALRISSCGSPSTSTSLPHMTASSFSTSDLPEQLSIERPVVDRFRHVMHLDAVSFLPFSC
jgi:hypothetical protein